MSRRTVSHEWDAFRRRIPANAPPTQYQDMRKAFYLGVASGLRLVVDHAEPDPFFRPSHTSIERGVLDDLVNEVGDFVKYTNAGKG